MTPPMPASCPRRNACPTADLAGSRPPRSGGGRFGRGLGIVLALVAFGVPSSAADRGWFRLVTPNFNLYSNARESEARRLLVELETFRHVVSRFLGLTHVQRRPALVYLFRDDDDFRAYKPLFNGTPRAISGLHVADPLDDALALNRQARGTRTMQVLFHEYTHLLTARPFRHAPVWLHEGVAEAFSTFTGEDDQFDIGIALTNHVRFLQQQGPVPVAQLLSVSRESPDYNEEQRAGKFYATAWLLAHHLVFARGAVETNVMARYAAFCAASTNQVEAFRRAFGRTPAEFDAPLRTYLQGGDYLIVRQRYPDLETARPVRWRLEPGELDYALGRLLQMTQRTEEALGRLERAAQLAPADPRPREALALQAWRQGQRTDLRSRLDEALQLGSKDAFIHHLAAQSRYEDYTRDRPPEPAATAATAALRDARRLCEESLRLDNDLAPAHHLLAVIVLAQHPRTPALALPHLQEALRCDPQNKATFLTLASVLALQGNLGTARQILTHLLAGPLPDDLRAAAANVAEQIDRRLQRPRPEPFPR